MRPLTETELKTLVEKLATYCGKGIQNLISDGTADRHVFRIQVRPIRNTYTSNLTTKLGVLLSLSMSFTCSPFLYTTSLHYASLN